MNVPPMVAAIISLRSTLPPVSDELRNRVQSIRVRSVPEVRTSTQPDRSSWRHKQVGPTVPPGQKSQLGGNWRNSSGNLSQGSVSPATPFRFLNTQQSPNDKSPTLTRVPSSFINALNSPSGQESPRPPMTPKTPTTPMVPARYVSKFHNGSKVGDDKILKIWDKDYKLKNP